jgi:seryl-tRNA synthetase
MARNFDNSDDVIDSRDVIERLTELRDEITELREALETAVEERDAASAERPDVIHADLEGAVSAAVAAVSDWNDDNAEELAALQSLADEASGSPDWEYGETLIRESYFQDYAMQLAEDIGAVKGDEGWPLNCIDWEKAARELKYDYFSVDFDGVTYLIRS